MFLHTGWVIKQSDPFKGSNSILGELAPEDLTVPVHRKTYNHQEKYSNMGKKLNAETIRKFNENGIRESSEGDYQFQEGIIRSGIKPDNFYLKRAKRLYIKFKVKKIFLISSNEYKEDLRELTEHILEKCQKKWERSPNDFLFKEKEHIFIDNIEIIDSEKKGEKKRIKIIQIDLVSNLYGTASYYLSKIDKKPSNLPTILARILAGLYPKEWKLPQNIPRYDPKDILQILGLLTHKQALKEYFSFFHGFFTENSWNISEKLYEIEKILEVSTDFHEGLTELHLILRIIHKSLLLTSFSEISDIKGEIDNYFQTISNPERYTDILYRRFHDTFVFLEKYQEETDFQDKLYFLEQSRKRIRNSEVLVREKFVYPFKYLYLNILEKWLNIANKETESFSEKAYLESELQTKRAIWKEKLLVSLNIKNIGTSTAKNIDISLQNSDEYKIFEEGTHHIDILHRNRDLNVEFYIMPLKENSIDLLFLITYGNNNVIKISGTLLFVQQKEFCRIPNPYNFTKPAEKNMFFGREDLLEWIEENMKGRTVYQNVLIEGQRRTGKTSFLKRLHRLIESDHYCVYIDLELYQDMEEVVFLLQICEELQFIIKADAPSPNLKEFINKRYISFKNYFENLIPNNSRKIVFIFDEFDKISSNIAKGLFKPGFLLFLRAFFQNNSRVNAVISGNFDSNKLNSPEWKEFLTVFNPKKIGVLDEKSAKDLVTKPVKDSLQYDEYAIKKILDFSGRNPFYIQLICHTLTNYINRNKRKNFVEAEDISSAVLNKAKERAELTLELTWDDLSKMEKNVLFVLSRLRKRQKKSIGLTLIQKRLKNKNIRVRRKDLFDTLGILVDKDIITKSGEYPSFYDFNIILLGEWIAENGSFVGE